MIYLGTYTTFGFSVTTGTGSTSSTNSSNLGLFSGFVSSSTFLRVSGLYSIVNGVSGIYKTGNVSS